MSFEGLAKLYEHPFEPDFDLESPAKEFIAMCGFSTNQATWLKVPHQYLIEPIHFLKYIHSNPSPDYESSIRIVVKSYGKWIRDFIRSSDEMNFVKI